MWAVWARLDEVVKHTQALGVLALLHIQQRACARGRWGQSETAPARGLDRGWRFKRDAVLQ